MDENIRPIPQSQKDRLLRQHDEFVDWFNDWVNEVEFYDESVGINPPAIYQSELIARLKQILADQRVEVESGQKMFNLKLTTEEIQVLILAIPYLLGNNQGLDLLKPTYLNPILRNIEDKIFKEVEKDV